jgi:hypothetical protein
VRRLLPCSCGLPRAIILGCSESDRIDVATSVKLLPNIKAALDKAAKADKRSVSSLLQKIISDWLEAHGFLK